mgnify:CR=1 FL=1
MHVFTSVRHQQLMLLSIAFVFVAMPLSHGQNGPIVNPKHRPPAPSFENNVYAPIVKLNGYPSATLVFNNRSYKEQLAYVTFYDQEGLAAPEQKISIPGNSVSYQPVEDLLPADFSRRPQLGGVSVRYIGHWNEVATQLILMTDLKTGSFEYRLVPTTFFKSRQQNAVWWMPSKGEAGIAIGNSGSSLATVSLILPDGKQKTFRLRGHETRAVIISPEDIGEEPGSVASAHIDFSGELGSVHATGYIRFPNGVSRTIRFYDPAATRQQALFASNLELQDRDIQLVLKNVGDVPLIANAKFYPVTESPSAVVELEPIELAPGEQSLVDVQRVLTESAGGTRFRATSVRILNNGPKGSLIGALASFNRMTGESFEIPLRDSGPLMNAGGSYPWRLDGDFETAVSITNITDEPAKFHAALHFAGGEYLTGPRTLQAGQTATFDIRRLRDEDIPDVNGKRIPRSVSRGQFNWSMIEGGSLTRLVGRSQITNRSAGISSSFSCPVCCPNDGPYYSFNPYGVSVIVDGIQQFTKTEDYWDSCYQQNYDWPSDIILTASNPSIAYSSSVQAGISETRGVAAGSTSDYYTYDLITYDNDSMDCYPNYWWNVGVGQPETVKPTISGPNTVWWFNGQNPNASAFPTTITLTAICGTSPCTSPVSWAATSGSSRVTLTPNGNQVSITSSGQYWSGTTGDISIKATTNGSTSNSFDVTSRRPWKLRFNAVFSGTECANNEWYTSIAYDLLDNLSSSISDDALWNESLGAPSCQSSNWCNWNIQGQNGSTGPIVDRLAPPDLGLNPNPTPNCTSPPVGQSAFRSIPQNHYVGSSISGNGAFVQSDYLGYYIDHGGHDLIVIPPRPTY